MINHPKNKAQIHSIELGSRDAPITFFLIHGYTGTPHDFNGLPKYLHETYGARVRVMLLPGHGTSVQDLDHVTYIDLVNAVEKEFKKELAAPKPIIVGGVSFGALMALHLAANYQVDGLISVGAPIVLKFPFYLPGISLLRHYKKYWPKKFTPIERDLRQGSFYYHDMHINGLAIVKKARRHIINQIAAITCPALIIHSHYDPISTVRSVKKLANQITSPQRVILPTNHNHNIFYSGIRNDVYNQIGSFFQDILHAPRYHIEQPIAAIVPAFNEAARLPAVLRTLLDTRVISEVIVVDDGSSDDTAAVAQSFSGVTVLRNQHNRGKAYSLDRAVTHTSAPILFFCDADLTDLTPQIITEIIQPVASGQCDMFIGVRNNVTQKALTLFALNSGERALRRELWQNLPVQFKHRYRLEVGLNFVARHDGRGYMWRKFEYYQTFKEKKYGFLQGTLLRWWMNLDVLYAYTLATLARLHPHQ